MSDTTQAVGRITILAAATLVFAVAWPGDEPAWRGRRSPSPGAGAVPKMREMPMETVLS